MTCFCGASQQNAIFSANVSPKNAPMPPISRIQYVYILYSMYIYYKYIYLKFLEFICCFVLFTKIKKGVHQGYGLCRFSVYFFNTNLPY